MAGGRDYSGEDILIDLESSLNAVRRNPPIEEVRAVVVWQKSHSFLTAPALRCEVLHSSRDRSKGGLRKKGKSKL